MQGTCNNIAIVWPPGRDPIVIAAYLTEAKVNGEQRDAVLAKVGRLTASMFVRI
ncbi:MAG: hypothetical protein ACR2GP_05120 [Burkholderiaceae bacterium]